MNICKFCKTVLKNDKNVFCNKSCAAKYNNSNRIRSEESKLKTSQSLKKKQTLKTKYCLTCNQLFETYSNTAKYCELHRTSNNRSKCLYCGSIKGQCKRPDICKKHQIFPTLEKYFGFDKNTIGTEKLYQEFERVVNLLKEDYWDNKLSIPDLVLKYSFKEYNKQSVANILKSLNIQTRNLSDAIKNAYVVGKCHPNSNNTIYRHRLSYNVG